MPWYHRLGTLPPKRHTALRKADGGIHQEQLMGNKGFTGPASLLYHLRPPTAVTAVRHMGPVVYEPDLDPTLRLRHFRSGRLPRGGSPTLDRTPLLFNSDVALLHVSPDREDEHFYRNGLGDEIVYVTEGSGVLQSPFGDLPYREGDHLVIHRGILHRFKMDDVPHTFFITESRGYVRTPSRYRNEYGQLVEGAPFSERDIRRPEELMTHDETGEFRLVVKQAGGLTESVLDHHPFDVAGWDGFYYPWAFNIHDFEPIVGMIHQPPPIHQTFQGDGFVVCAFVPRPYDFHPDSIPAPYAHSNVMSDEVLYYLTKEFMSRKGIDHGSITLHPDGMPHGPHPGRYEGSMGQKRTEELALMVDTFKPLMVARPALEIEDPDYHLSWAE